MLVVENNSKYFFISTCVKMTKFIFCIKVNRNRARLSAKNDKQKQYFMVSFFF